VHHQCHACTDLGTHISSRYQERGCGTVTVHVAAPSNYADCDLSTGYTYQWVHTNTSGPAFSPGCCAWVTSPSPGGPTPRKRHVRGPQLQRHRRHRTSSSPSRRLRGHGVSRRPDGGAQQHNPTVPTRSSNRLLLLGSTDGYLRRVRRSILRLEPPPIPTRRWCHDVHPLGPAWGGLGRVAGCIFSSDPSV